MTRVSAFQGTCRMLFVNEGSWKDQGELLICVQESGNGVDLPES